VAHVISKIVHGVPVIAFDIQVIAACSATTTQDTSGRRHRALAGLMRGGRPDGFGTPGGAIACGSRSSIRRANWPPGAICWRLHRP
jgi:hypothetical protein